MDSSPCKLPVLSEQELIKLSTHVLSCDHQNSSDPPAPEASTVWQAVALCIERESGNND